MVLQFGNIVVDIDAEKTASFYRTSKILTDDCSCTNCRNFVLGSELLSHDILDFFQNLGIDISKPVEMVAWDSEDNGNSIYYGGWYHICGQMISDTDCWLHDSENNSSSINENNVYSVTPNFSIGFTNSVSLKDKCFPEPIIQMEVFIHHFPWVLNEPHTF